MSHFFKKHLDALGIVMGAVFFVGLGFMAQRLLDWDRPCLRFDGVIELHVDGHEDGVRSCQRTSRFQTNTLPQQTQKFIEDINELKRIQFLFPDGLRGVFVTITERDPFFLLFSERSLVIGIEIARNSKALQKAILSAVSFQSLAGFDGPGKETRADLLWYLFAGDEEWTDPTLGIKVDPKKWMRLAALPETVEDYCSSPLRQIYDLSFCRYELDKKRRLSLAKRYQPLISWTAYKALRASGLASSTDYLRSLFDSSERVPASEEVPSVDEAPLELASYYVRDEVKKLLSSHRFKAADVKVAQIWEPYAIAPNGDFDFVVEVDDPALMDSVLNSLTEWQKNSLVGLNSRVLIVNGETQLELPLAQRVKYPIDQIRSGVHLVLACRLPGIQTVAEFKAENLIALQVCDSSELPQWAEILEETSPAKKTAALRLEIHLPSLKRWSQHAPEVVASNVSLDRVFCRPDAFLGYPFTVKNCPHVSR